jgi:hypothetical protein
VEIEFLKKFNYQKVFEAILQDEQYLGNLDWGKPRSGHPEGSLRAHIHDLEGNLQRLQSLVSREDYFKLLILIHVHDIFKPDSKFGVPIAHPRSHASLAREFLSGYCDDPELLGIVQHHDEPYALWKHYQHSYQVNEGRLRSLLETIKNWDLFRMALS